MQYKTITLGLLQKHSRPTTIAALDHYSAELRANHLALSKTLLKADSPNSQAQSQALELAIQELEEHLRQQTEDAQDSQELSLDAAMNFLRRQQHQG